VGNPFVSRRALSVLAALAVAVGFSAGCGSSGSNSQGSEAGTSDATTSSSGVRLVRPRDRHISHTEHPENVTIQRLTLEASG
jgi:hypothetical protein